MFAVSDYFGDTLGGQCFQGACLATCDGTIAEMERSQAIRTAFVRQRARLATCWATSVFQPIHSPHLVSAQVVPAEIDNGDGTFDCIPPSGEACAVLRISGRL